MVVDHGGVRAEPSEEVGALNVLPGCLGVGGV